MTYLLLDLAGECLNGVHFWGDICHTQVIALDIPGGSSQGQEYQSGYNECAHALSFKKHTCHPYRYRPYEMTSNVMNLGPHLLLSYASTSPADYTDIMSYLIQCLSDAASAMV